MRKPSAKSAERNLFITEENSLSLYLKEISRHKPLSAAKEYELAARIHKGDRHALEELVLANLRFVVSVSRNYQNQGLPLADMINEGNVGLIRAAKRFDEKKNFKFISYAVWWIRQAILQALAEQSRIVKLPLNRVGAIHRITKMQSKLEQKLHRLPQIEEIAQALELDDTEVRETMKIGNSHMSLDAPLQHDDSSSLMDLMQDHSHSDPDGAIMEVSLHEAIHKTLDTLSKRERDVIRLYFGIGEDTSHTLEEIGQRFSLTRERARQIKEKALYRLKHASRSKSLTQFRTD